MTKKIYIPTEEELEEMGFIYTDTQYELDISDSFGIVYYESKRWELFMINTDGIWCAHEFHPNSKQALIEFISNFSPNA